MKIEKAEQLTEWVKEHQKSSEQHGDLDQFHSMVLGYVEGHDYSLEADDSEYLTMIDKVGEDNFAYTYTELIDWVTRMNDELLSDEIDSKEPNEECIRNLMSDVKLLDAFG